MPFATVTQSQTDSLAGCRACGRASGSFEDSTSDDSIETYPDGMLVIDARLPTEVGQMFINAIEAA